MATLGALANVYHDGTGRTNRSTVLFDQIILTPFKESGFKMSPASLSSPMCGGSIASKESLTSVALDDDFSALEDYIQELEDYIQAACKSMGTDYDMIPSASVDVDVDFMSPITLSERGECSVPSHISSNSTFIKANIATCENTDIIKASIDIKEKPALAVTESKLGNTPSESLSAFLAFSKENRANLLKEYPYFTLGEIGKELGARWKKLSLAQQETYCTAKVPISVEACSNIETSTLPPEIIVKPVNGVLYYQDSPTSITLLNDFGEEHDSTTKITELSTGIRVQLSAACDIPKDPLATLHASSRKLRSTSEKNHSVLSLSEHTPLNVLVETYQRCVPPIGCGPSGFGALGFIDQTKNYKQKYVTRDNTATLLNHRQLSVKTILSLQHDVFPTDLNKAEIMTIFTHSAFLKKSKAERHQHACHHRKAKAKLKRSLDDPFLSSFLYDPKAQLILRFSGH
jgi:hypothetical protein